MQVLFDFEQPTTAEDAEDWRGVGLDFEAMETTWDVADVFDLVLWLGEAGGGLEGEFAFDSSLFDEQTVARMAAQFQMLLEGVASRSGSANLANCRCFREHEREQVLVDWNRTQVELAPPALRASVVRGAGTTLPDAVALVFECPHDDLCAA